MNKLILLSLFLISCATKRPYLENAKKYYDNELYYKALSELQLGQNQYKDNADYNIALKKTQDKVYELELLKVRDTREAGNPLEALEQVRKADAKLKKWKILTNINGSTFRKKEVEKLMFSLKSYLDRDIDKGFILKAHKTLKSYSDVLSSLSSYREYEKEIFKKGKEQCQSFNDNNEFFNSFIKKYCNYFRESRELVTNYKDKLYDVSKVSLKVDDESISGFNFMSKTKIYHPKSYNRISSDTRIETSYEEKKSSERKSVRYSDKEYYWKTVYDTYYITENYWTTELRCNYLNKLNPCQNQRVQKSRLVPRQRSRKVKKSKTVYRNYNYTEQILTQYLKIKGTSFLYMNGKKIIINHDYTKKEVNRYHNNSSRKAGVSPKKLSIKDIGAWKQEELNNIQYMLRDEVISRWNSSYCREGRDLMEDNVNFVKCSMTNDKHSYLEQWSIKHYGLDFQSLKALLGL